MRFASDQDRLACDRFFAERPIARDLFELVGRSVDGLVATAIVATKSRVAGGAPSTLARASASIEG